MASSGTGLLVFSDDVTEDRNSRMNSEVYRDILSAQIQPKLIGRRFIAQINDDLKHRAKWVFEGKKEYSVMAKSISWSWACISLANDKTKGRNTHKQTTTEVSCSKDLTKHHKGGNPVSGDVHEFQT